MPFLKELISLFCTIFADPFQERVFGGLCIKMHFHLFWWPLLVLILFASSYCWFSRLCLVWIMTQGLSNLFLLLLTIKCSRCPKDCAFGQLSPDGFPPEMSLQKPPGCHHMWVTMMSTRFRVAWGLSTVFGSVLAFPKAGNEEKGQLAKVVQNDQCWWKWLRDKKTKQGFLFCLGSLLGGVQILYFTIPLAEWDETGLSQQKEWQLLSYHLADLWAPVE